MKAHVSARQEILKSRRKTLFARERRANNAVTVCRNCAIGIQRMGYCFDLGVTVSTSCFCRKSRCSPHVSSHFRRHRSSVHNTLVSTGSYFAR